MRICFLKSTFSRCREATLWTIPKANIRIYQEDPLITKTGKHPVRLSIEELVRQAKIFPQEFPKWLKERKRALEGRGQFYGDPEHDDYEIAFSFNSKETIDRWIVTADRDNEDGSSVCTFRLSTQKTALFQGFLSMRPKADGNPLTAAGYVNIRAPMQRKSFKRMDPYNWKDYTHLLVRCRGDGRTYAVNLHMNRFYDVQWDDMYTYPLYTHGGPYWQLEKIPISKFFFSNQGRIQDNQHQMEKENIKTLSISHMDTFSGPFSLELDFIALIHDSNHKEKFAYETYRVPIAYKYG